MRYKNVNIFKPEAINPKDNELPIFVGERRLAISLPRDPDAKEAYDHFYQSIGTFIEKVPNAPARNAVSKLYERRIIFLGRDVTIPAKTGIIGSYLINKTKFAGVILDTVELEIDAESGETSNIDSCFYASYFEFLRAASAIHSARIKEDRRFHEYLIKYLFYIYLRLIGVNVNLNTKQKDLLNILCSYFFYRFLVGIQHQLAKETVYKTIPKDFQKEVDSLVSRLEKYTGMRDIFKGLVDFRLTSESPPALMIKALSRFKPTVFYALTSSLDYLISVAVVSKYPMGILRNVAVSNELQSSIEEFMIPLINQVKFDTTAVKSL